MPTSRKWSTRKAGRRGIFASLKLPRGRWGTPRRGPCREQKTATSLLGDVRQPPDRREDQGAKALNHNRVGGGGGCNMKQVLRA